jgi:hypothetical protein
MQNDLAGGTEERTSSWAATVAALVVAAIALVYTPPIYQRLGGQTVLWIYDLTNITIAGLGSWLAFLLWRSFHRGETLSVIWGSLSTGLLLWSVGEIIWASDQLLFGEKLPYPSTADVVWLLGYLPIIAGLAVRFRTLQMRVVRPAQLGILALFVVGMVLTGIYVILPILRDPEAGTSLEKLVSVLYPAGDLVVAFFALLLVLVLRGGMLFAPWGLIALGFLGFAASDILYTYAVWQGLYQVDPALGIDFMSYTSNLLYTLSYILVALGIYQRARLQNAV